MKQAILLHAPFTSTGTIFFQLFGLCRLLRLKRYWLKFLVHLIRASMTVHKNVFVALYNFFFIMSEYNCCQ